MATVIFKVGSAGTGRDYATLAAAWAAIPADVVGSGNSYELQLYNDSEFVLGTSTLLLTGKTTNATHTITICPAPGQGFSENPNVNAHPYAYNQANGVAIRSNAGYANAIEIKNDYVTCRGLQIKHAAGGNSGAGISINGAYVGIVIDNCIIDMNQNGSYVFGIGAMSQLAVVDIRNTLIVLRNQNSIGIETGLLKAGSIENCTVARVSDVTGTPTGDGIRCSSDVGTTQSVINCAVFNCTNPFTNTVGPASNNATDKSSIPFGTNNKTGLTYASQFVNTTLAGMDFRLQATSALVDVGTAPSSGNTTGPSGARVMGPAADIGAWEYVKVASTITLTPPSAVNKGYAARFDLSLDGNPASPTTITPTDGGAGGTFNPTSVLVPTNASTASFTYTAPATGDVTISIANDKGLSNPNPTTVTVTQRAPSGAVTSQPAPDGQNLEITFSTQDSPTSGLATLTPADSTSGAITTSGTVTLGSGTGTASFTNIPPGNYTPTITLSNAGGPGSVSGLQAVSIIGITCALQAPTSDANAPTMVGSIAASGITTTGFTLSWQAATDDVGVAGYEYSTDGGSTWIDNGTNTTKAVTGKSSGTQYNVGARAYDAAGNRSAALTATVTTTAIVADTTPPVMAGAISVSNVTSSGFTFSWQAATDNVGVTGYETSTDGGTSWTSNGAATSKTVSNATASTQYHLAARAKDAAGNASTPLTATVTTSAASGGGGGGGGGSATIPGAPTSVLATATIGGAVVAFSPPSSNGGSPITGYIVKASTGQSLTVLTSPAIMTLPAGVPVSFTVRAVNAQGPSADSPTSNTVTPASSGGSGGTTTYSLEPAPRERVIRM